MRNVRIYNTVSHTVAHAFKVDMGIIELSRCRNSLLEGTVGYTLLVTDEKWDGVLTDSRLFKEIIWGLIHN